MKWINKSPHWSSRLPRNLISYKSEVLTFTDIKTPQVIYRCLSFFWFIPPNCSYMQFVTGNRTCITAAVIRNDRGPISSCVAITGLNDATIQSFRITPFYLAIVGWTVTCILWSYLTMQIFKSLEKIQSQIRISPKHEGSKVAIEPTQKFHRVSVTASLFEFQHEMLSLLQKHTISLRFIYLKKSAFSF